MSRMNPQMQAKLEAERRLKEGISGHRTGLPKKLLDLFAPQESPAQLTDLKKPKIRLPYTGIAQYVTQFADQGDTEYEPAAAGAAPSSPRLFANPELRIQARVEDESIWERRIRKDGEKVEEAKQQIHESMRDWDPTKDPTATGDPFKTLFVARLSYDVTERKLSREFEEFGPIKNIRLVHEKNSGKSRGYAFIEFEHKNDMKTAYKMADGKKIEGKRITVDVERGRTVPNWRPRRFGGGKGGETREKKISKKKERLAHLLVAPKRPAPERDEEALRQKEKDKEAEKDRERGRDRDRERERPKEVDPTQLPPSEPRPDHGHERDADRQDRGGDRHERDRSERDRDRDRHRERDRDDGHRDRDRERKRDRGDRDKGERDRYDDSHRSSKRHRDDRERSSRRRERDML